MPLTLNKLINSARSLPITTTSSPTSYSKPAAEFYNPTKIVQRTNQFHGKVIFSKMPQKLFYEHIRNVTFCLDYLCLCAPVHQSLLNLPKQLQLLISFDRDDPQQLCEVAMVVVVQMKHSTVFPPQFIVILNFRYIFADYHGPAISLMALSELRAFQKNWFLRRVYLWY